MNNNDDRQTMEFSTGATRSQDGEHLDFTSLPLIGLISVARTAREGREKHGRFNFKRGIPSWTCVNRAFRHMVMWCLGDRSKPHLSHAIWNLLNAEESEILFPELNAPHNLGPGSTLPAAMLAFLESGDAERSRRRAAGEFDHLEDWDLAELPEVVEILRQRAAAQSSREDSAKVVDDGAKPDSDGTGELIFAAPTPIYSATWKRHPDGHIVHEDGWLVRESYVRPNFFVIQSPDDRVVEGKREGRLQFPDERQAWDRANKIIAEAREGKRILVS